MLDLFKELVPVLAVVLGWGLSEMHHVLADRKSRSGALKQALAELLEVRFKLKAVDVVVGEIKARTPDARSVMPHVRNALDVLIGGAESQRYTAAIDLLARSDPFLAYELMSRDRVGAFFSTWRATAVSAGADAGDLESMESELKILVGPKLDDLVLNLAGKISWRAKFKTRKIIATSFNLPPDLTKLLDRVAQN